MASDSYLIHHVSCLPAGPRQSAKRQRSIISCRRCHLSRASEASILLSSTPASARLHQNLRCVPVQAVCQRGCLSAGGIVTPIGKKRGGMPRLLMSLRIYIACACCAVYVYISYLLTWMHVCVHCGPEWTSCCALHCMARSLG